MEGRGGCCIARYASGAYDMSKVDRIMLRFRPIAPKPVVGGTPSDGSSSESGDALSRCGGAKRKYSRDNNGNKRCNRRVRRRKNTVPSPENKHPMPVVTLPLLPETPDPKDPPTRDLTVSSPKNYRNENVPAWLSFENHGPVGTKVDPNWYGGATATDLPPVGVVGSCVTVECVTDTWENGEGLGSTDQERRTNLSKDTCPGFISDGYGRVTWTNLAYGETLGQEGVRLALKVRIALPYPSFTCRVRVQYCVRGKERSLLTVPCDVWRMDSGGFAWRLDVKAALSLSLGW